ncbi:COMM domain-containing protein 6 [Bagarius yarrelli]|uniref:COMM domain-containing protein 6 n=1 Tax=Bagarius yarrelli TaxID=175774 RepID=A0A556V5E4_BAGYA|nr:COMM domain-containing protein 6 [Bagarius yarrelli]
MLLYVSTNNNPRLFFNNSCSVDIYVKHQYYPHPRSAAKRKLTADGLVTKLGECGSKWSKSALQVMHQLWTEHGSVVQAHQELQAVASIGQLVDLQWKLGMAVSSDTCRSLNSPYISILIKIADTSGEISYKSFEMTVPQFQVCEHYF